MALVSKGKKIFPEGVRPTRKKEHSPRTSSKGNVRLLALVLIIVEALSLALTYRAIRTSRSAVRIFKYLLEFQDAATLANDNAHLTGFAVGYSTQPDYWEGRSAGYVQEQRDILEKLDSRFDRIKKKSSSMQGFRLDIEKEIKDMKKNYQAYIEISEALLFYVYTRNPHIRNNTFDEYASGLFDSNQFVVETTRALAAGSLLKLVDKTYNSTNKTTTFIVSLVGILLILVTSLLCLALGKVAEASLEIEACDKCVRQQAHEIRNRLSPAIWAFEQFLELVDRADVTIKDFKSQAHHMSLAFMALREVEGQLQARLDIFKILSNKYVSKAETIDICELMDDRIDVEQAISQAKSTNAGQQNQVDFRMETPCYEDCTTINIRADLYILNHVITNLLSNSRKFCHFGEIVLTFHGEETYNNKKLLRFSCSDTGTGIPTAVAKNIFAKGSIQGDNRGTGLGMPSCSIFVQAVGGWIRLKETRQQQYDQEISGYTEFEFAIAGHVVSTEKITPTKEQMKAASSKSFIEIEKRRNSTIDNPRMEPMMVRQSLRQIKVIEDSVQMHKVPNDVVVVIVDDSSLNRTCLQSRLKRVQAELNVLNWDFKHFETFETAMPTLRKIHESNQVAIITLDEDYSSRGGVMSGIQGTKWLLQDLKFKYIVISSSGDEDVGLRHLELGAQLNWAKPLKNYKSLLADIISAFASLGT